MSDIVQVLFDRNERLEILKSDPVKLAACKIYYKTHPVEFINDWAMTYDPRVTPAIIPFTLYPRQVECIKWLYDKWLVRSDGIVEKSRDCGATWMSVAFSVWLWLFHENQAVGFGSRKQELVDKIDDPKCIFEKIRMLIRLVPAVFRPIGFNERKHLSFLKIVNCANGSTIAGEAGDDIGRGGRTSIYFKDESAFYERPHKIEAALSQNSDCKIDISTPNGIGNPFHKKRMAGVLPLFTFNWRDDPRKDNEWYRKQVRELDPVIVAQEVDIDYSASVNNVLINSKWVEAASRVRPTDLGPNYAPMILGVDVARFGEDKSALVLRQGRVIHYIETIAKNESTELAGRIIWFIQNNPKTLAAVVIDIGGLGAGAYDIVKEKYGGVYGVQFQESSNKTGYDLIRDEMWGEMKEWLKGGSVSIPNDGGLMGDLSSLQYSFNSDGEMKLESKEAAKKRGVKSPDLGDALALTFVAPQEAFKEWHDQHAHKHDGRSPVTGY